MLHRANKAKPIFISYRRSDANAITNYIYSRLNHRFKGKVFMDVYAPIDGSDFRDRLDLNLNGCSIALVVIGRSWLDVTGPPNVKRLDEEDDLVRWEVATALRREIPIITLLVEGAQVPPKGQLPPELEKLRGKDLLEFHLGPDFENDIGKLINSLENILHGTLHRAARNFYFKYERPMTTIGWLAISCLIMALALLLTFSLTRPFILNKDLFPKNQQHPR